MESLEHIKHRLRDFADERDWDQFHSPKNLAMAMIVEAAELVEHFQWLTEDQSQTLPPDKLGEVEQEIADIQIYLIRLADKLGIDMEQASRIEVLVALRRMLGLLNPPQSAQALGLEVSRDGGRGDAGFGGDLPGGLLAPPQLQHPLHHAPGRLASQSVRSAGTVLEAGLALYVVSGQPLVGRLAGHSGGLGRLRDPPAELSDPMDQKPA